MWATVAAFIGLLATALTWYFSTEKQRRKDALTRRIRALEKEHDEALSRQDMVAVARLQLELYRLRQEQGNRPSQ